MSIERYVTDPAAVVVSRAVKLGAIWVTHHPVEDPDVGLAHLTYDGALAIAERVGARLPTTAEILALHEAAAAAGTELTPLILPDADLRSQGCVPGDARMVTRNWCVRHDGPVLATIAAFVEQDSAVGNAGKHWRGGAPDGLAGICGWWVRDRKPFGGPPGPGFIQAGDGWPHNRLHADYATTTVLCWDVDPRQAS